MEYILKNKYLKVKIASLGAELQEIIDQDNINRMHKPNKLSWNRVSPILFPQISKTRDLLYKVDNKEYHMPAHGFFRNMEHQAINYSDDKIIFCLKDNEETLKLYPYHFEFYVQYELIENKLKVSFNIINTDNKIMYYMIGGHPGFEIPLYNDEKYEDYSVVFEKKETSRAMQVVDGYLANVYKPYLNNENTINLNHDLFNPDAIVLTDLQSKYVDLVSKNHQKKIRFYFSDFKILAIWSLQQDNATFVCFEPWNGIQKDFVVEHEKMGILSLDSKQSSNYSYIIEIIN